MEVPEKEVRSRVRRLQERMEAEGLEAALVGQNVDRYYLSGSMQGGWVVVPCRGEPVFLVRRDRGRARAESRIPVRDLPSLRDLASGVEEALGGFPSPLGLELDVLPVAQFQRIKGLFPGVEIRNVSPLIQAVRSVKSPWELAAVGEAARVVAEAVEVVPEVLRPGITELELAARVEYELRRRGHGGFLRMRGFNQEIFYGHVMAGPAAAEPSFLDAPTGGRGQGPALPQGSSRRPIGPGEPVVVDLVGNHGGYLCDQTRVFSIGPLPAELRRAFDEARRIEDAVAAEARPGVEAGRLFDLAREVADRSPFGPHFLGYPDPVQFVGHGIGLEVDEPPFLARGSRTRLEEGMVFALEPKFVFPGAGVVGIENTYRVVRNGVERITLSPPGVREVPQEVR